MNDAGGQEIHAINFFLVRKESLFIILGGVPQNIHLEINTPTSRKKEKINTANKRKEVG